jgi:hypothetical protein
MVFVVAAVVLPQQQARASAPPAIPTANALVRFQPGTTAELQRAAHARVGARVLATIPKIGYQLISFPKDIPLDAVLASYRSDPAVRVAEPNYAGRVALTPSDSCLGSACAGYANQWHLAMTNAPFGWNVVPGRTYDAAAKKTLKPVTIAVLDTKIDASHPDFMNGGTSSDAAQGGQLDLANAHDWIDSSRWSGGAAYHGTFVAGLAAASTGNARGAAGIGYAARIMPLTVVDGGGNTDAAALADAIVYAWLHGARVINLSLGILGDSAAVHDAIRTVVRGDATHPASLVVAAAGNNTGTNAFYPGSYPEVMSVSGTDAADLHASCSNTNPNVSVSAPADRLIGLTVMPTERIQAACGTSAAAPQVSGLASLLFTQDLTRTPAQVRQIVERSADDLGQAGRDDVFGAGRINGDRALRYGSGPSITSARASDPSNATTTVTAVATATDAIRGAQVIFGSPDATPVAMQAVDGSFNNTTERVRATISIPSGTTPGAHPVWIRATDGTTWGGSAVTVLYIDARSPVISGLAASNSVRAANQPITITFNATDDRSPTLVYGVEFRSQATNAIIARIASDRVGQGARTVTWTPSLTAPSGPYLVKLAVADETGNVTVASTGAVVT